VRLIIIPVILSLLICDSSCVKRHNGDTVESQENKTSKPDLSFQKLLRQKGIPLSEQFNNDFEQLQPGNLYTNHYYNLTIDFPNHWKTDRGPHEYSVIRAFEADSGISITLGVIPEPIKLDENASKKRNTMEYLNPISHGDPARFYRESLEKQSGITIEDLNVKDLKIGHYEFIGPVYRVRQQFPSGTIYYMKIITLQTTLFNNAFSISYSAPEDFFDQGVLESVLNRFQVIN
jgi:hypothetical protein